MKHWEHLNFEHRKIIASLLSKQIKLVEIADTLNFDPTSISKEIRRNRTLIKNGTSKNTCSNISRYPYCCNACPKRYHNQCHKMQYIYKAKDAQASADHVLVSSRTGLDISEEEFLELNMTVKHGLENKESIYHIIESLSFKISVATVYRYINLGYLDTKRIDLPYAVTYKKRKQNKQYDYTKHNNSINRSGRTYDDYLAYKFNHPHKYPVQIDFLGSIVTDKKSILTVIIPDLHFVMLFIIESPTKAKVLDAFDSLELNLRTKNFSKVFPYILTDRDPCFSDFNSFETSIITHGQRTNIFYCDPYTSSQKGSVEQMNKQLRKFFPKKKSIDHLTQADVSMVARTINSHKIRSLSGSCPEDIVLKLYGQEILNALR